MTPTWPQLRGRLAARRPRTMRGVLRYVDPRANPDYEATEGFVRFRYEAPSRWRVEDDRGPLHLEDDDWAYWRDGRSSPAGIERRPKNILFLGALPAGHPRRLFDEPTEFDDTRGDLMFGSAAAVGPPVAVEVAGRAAWRFPLLNHWEGQTFPWEVTADDATGLVLRLVRPETGQVLECVELELDGPLDPADFTWDGPFHTDGQDELEELEAAQEWMCAQVLPVVRYWPGGMGHDVKQVDPATGAFVVRLEAGNTWPVLARWPAGGSAPRAWRRYVEDRVERSAHMHRHEWAEGAWEWGLLLDEPMDPADLARVIASISVD